jgi:hypothetical protein
MIPLAMVLFGESRERTSEMGLAENHQTVQTFFFD